MEPAPDIATLVQGLASESESARKYAVFRLQNLLSDTRFAASFVETDGLEALGRIVLDSNGNTQAYSLGSLSKLLECGYGWEIVNSAVIEKAVQLAVTHPLVNIVRNSLSVLALVVGRPQWGEEDAFGFRAIKPALDSYPSFLESLVQRLSASDHTLCANALLLVNALMRDAVVNGGEHEWPRFIKRLQDLGVIGGVGMLMRGDAATDPRSMLAGAILEFQGLTKVLLRKWKEVGVNVDLPEHKRALKQINLLSKPEPHGISEDTTVSPTREVGPSERRSRSRKHHPQKWRRLGFETESPAWEFDETGYLGMMDLVDYARRNEDVYQKSIMEQAVQSTELRCPIARASLSITLILYEHFEIGESIDFEIPGQRSQSRPISPNATVDQLYRPLLLQWGRLHTSALHAFFRLWKASGAQDTDFYKVEDVVRVTFEHIVGAASRKTEIAKVEEELRNVSLEQARKWQMEGLEEVYEDAWGPHLTQVREQLQHESLQFMREQRIRCMLQGSWFPTAATLQGSNPFRGAIASWRFVKLSLNRRYLHYQNYQTKGLTDPPLDELTHKIDLNAVTSVDSNVSTLANNNSLTNGEPDRSSTDTLRNDTTASKQSPPAPQTKITILGTVSRTKPEASDPTTSSDPEELPLLVLHPPSPSAAAEWLDGLLMLLHQQPITADTTNLVAMMVDWGVRLRRLNLRWEDVDWEVLEQGAKGLEVRGREVPSREGLWEGEVGEGFWFQMGEG